MSLPPRAFQKTSKVIALEPSNGPKPNVMPVDREKWAQELHLSNFINTYYQFRDLQMCGDPKSVLIVGPGQKLDTNVLQWRGYGITTLDIDDTFEPDYQGSVHDLSMFADLQFDVVIASHVLEHLAVAYLDRSLKEISRVARYAIVYLPVAGRTFQVRFLPGVLSIDWSLLIDVFNFFEKPDGVTPKYCQGQHYWEIGRRGFRIKDLVRRMSRSFEILKVYRNRDWTPSQNFVLKSKRA